MGRAWLVARFVEPKLPSQHFGDDLESAPRNSSSWSRIEKDEKGRAGKEGLEDWEEVTRPVMPGVHIAA